MASVAHGTHSNTTRPAGTSLPLLAVAGTGVALLGFIAGAGGPHDAITGASIVVWRALTSGALAALSLLAAYGFGRLLDPLTRGLGDPEPARWGLGLALWFTLIHLLGWLGALTPLVAAGITVLGLALVILIAAVPWLRTQRKPGWRALRPSPLWAALPAVIVLVVASANPPGWLWGSEFGGYDALSYHLPLVREWIAMGAIRPMEHNVYSYLPSYAEAGFMHIAQMVRLPGTLGFSDPISPEHVLLAHDGLATYAAQYMHAGLGLIGARAMLGVVQAARGSSPDTDDARPIGWIAGAVLLATPWVVVVGSLAYNELGVVSLSACALSVAMSKPRNATDPAHTHATLRTGLICGLLSGAACGFKPTALLFVAPALGVAMLLSTPVRVWATLILAACVGGLLMLAPWLIRNTIAGGNPVFPQLTGVFGTAHWDTEQAARYAAAHVSDAGMVDRLRLLVWTDPTADETAPAVQRFRGFANPQWGGLALLAIIGAGTACRRIGARRGVAILIGGLLVQCIAWLLFTHLQSRFLLPSVVWLAALVALGCDAIAPRRAGVLLGSGVVLLLALWTCWNFLGQARPRDSVSPIGMPNAWVLPGTSAFAGPDAWTTEGFDARYRPGDVQGLAPADLAWTAALNGLLPEGSTVLLVGDATPFYIAGPVVYATTYDRSPLAIVMQEHPSDPPAWTQALLARGITHALIAPSELARLEASGWLDPAFTAALETTEPNAQSPRGAQNTLQAWLRSLGAPVMVWDAQQGRALFRLDANRTREGTHP